MQKLSQLASGGVVDEFQLVVHPVVLGAAKRLFDGVEGSVSLALTSTRAFPKGKVLLCYRPADA